MICYTCWLMLYIYIYDIIIWLFPAPRQHLCQNSIDEGQMSSLNGRPGQAQALEMSSSKYLGWLVIDWLVWITNEYWLVIDWLIGYWLVIIGNRLDGILVWDGIFEGYPTWPTCAKHRLACFGCISSLKPSCLMVKRSGPIVTVKQFHIFRSWE